MLTTLLLSQKSIKMLGEVNVAVPSMLIFMVNIKCTFPQCLFLEGYLANEMMVCVHDTVAAAWAFSESF